MLSSIRIATRKSPLAMWQANYVAQQLQQHYPQLTIEFVPIETQGDKILDTPLAKIGGKGLFVKQLETALLNHEADIAVHSVKDIPVHFADNLQLTAICQRADPRDAFVSNQFSQLSELPKGSIIGTSSLRRQSQLRAIRPNLMVKDLRGNIGTRIAKLDNNEYDAIILAAAGLQRLNLQKKIKQLFSIDQMLPAVGQGVIGIESRADCDALNQLLSVLDHYPTKICVNAERALNRTLDGGCQVPIACHAILYDNVIRIRALISDLDGQHKIYFECQGASNEAEQLGEKLAIKLLEHGADALLQRLYQEKT